MQRLRRLTQVLALLSLTAFAQQGPPGRGGPQGGGQPPSPPAEALAACQGKAAEAACTFSDGGRAMEGTCFTPASDKPLACRPARPPPQPQG